MDEKRNDRSPDGGVAKDETPQADSHGNQNRMEKQAPIITPEIVNGVSDSTGGVAYAESQPETPSAVPPPKRPPSRLAWMGIGIFIGLGLAAAALTAFLMIPKDETGIFIDKNTIIISIEDLHRAFVKDVASAERMYKNMPLLITGKIKNINTASSTKSTNIGLETGGVVPAIAHFDKQRADIIKLKEGQVIALKCQFEKFGPLSITEFFEHKSGKQKMTGFSGMILDWGPNVPFVEIVQLKKCELIQWEH
jgi:hypothetical protein